MSIGAQRLRELLARPDILTMPGVNECIGARVVEEARFEVVYVSGSGTSATRLGMPDLGIATMDEVVDNARRVAQSTSLPVFADADTGYGNPLNVMRTVRLFENAGVAGIHIEDQEHPKRCGQFEGKVLIPQAEMVQKLRAACDVRRDPAFVIMARVDAIPVEGFVDAMRRAEAYVSAGADLVWLESTRSIQQLEEISSSFGAMAMHNMDASRKSPHVTVAQLAEMGFKIASFCGISIWALAWVQSELMRILKETGDLEQARHILYPWQKTYDLLGLSELQEKAAAMEAIAREMDARDASL